MARVRSPNYPVIDLGDAVDKVRRIYESERNHTASRQVLAVAMGYAGITGSSAKMLAALKKYGLLEGRGESLRVSEDALAILLAPTNSDERKQAIERCAFTPELFQRIRSQYDDQMPSRENLRYFLAKQGFSAQGVEAVVTNYAKTLEFLQDNTASVRPGSASHSLELTVPSTPGSAPIVREQPDEELKQEMVEEKLEYRISRSARVELRFHGPVTRESIEKLIKLLEITKDDYPDEIIT
mgnify:CR=1 FL=1